jgi:hypothetical protein
VRVIQVSAQADPDGVIRLSIPVGASGGEYEIAVVVSPRPAVNGSAGGKTPEELGWPPGFFQNVIGSIDDDTFVAPPRGPVRPVEPIE